MNRTLFQPIVLGLILSLAGCGTQPARSTATEVGARPSAPAPGVGGESSLPAGEYTVVVESEPRGATVVVNGIPVGKAPQRVILPGTSRGFFRDPVSLKVRFIATDTTNTSKTVEELLTPLDRIPAVVKFTASGATRVARN